jgi:hypothetical protein
VTCWRLLFTVIAEMVGFRPTQTLTLLSNIEKPIALSQALGVDVLGLLDVWLDM